MKKGDMILLLWRIPLDFLAVSAGWFLAYFLRPLTDLIPGVERIFPAESLPLLSFFLPFALGSALAFVLLAAFLEHYRFRESFEPVREGGKLAFTIFLWGMLIVAWYALFRHELIFSRVALGQAMLFSWAFTLLLRCGLHALQRYNWRQGRNRKRVILIGSAASTEAIEHLLNLEPQFTVVRVATPGELEALTDETISADELWRCDPRLTEAETQKIRALAEARHLTYRFLPREKTFAFTRLELMLLQDMPFLVARPAILTLWQRVLKRGLDLAFAGMLLLVLSPLLILIAIGIKLDSRGPVFFRSTRLGRDAKPFQLWKFRSMIADAERHKQKLEELSHRDGPLFKVKNDPRVTRFGRLLRRFSLDELPNFFNVLKGEMSVVGPRPHLPEEIDRYEPWQRRVLGMKPGVTGLAQISGRSDLPFADEVRLDLYYLENWNFWLDLRIIVETFGVVISQQGAD